MKLTICLCRGKRVHRDVLQSLRNRLWRTRGSVMQVDRLRVPQRLIRDDTPSIVSREAEDMFTTSRYTDALAAEIELGIPSCEARALEADKRRHMGKWSCHAGDPRYEREGERESCLFFSAHRRFSKGLDQASVLTNSVISNERAPKCLNSVHDQLLDRFQALSVLQDNEKDNDETVRWAAWSRNFVNKVELAIFHAHVWNTEETKLPRRFRPELPIWKHKIEYGIHPTQATRLLTQNLFRLIEAESTQLQQLIDPQLSVDTAVHGLPKRWTTRDRLLETFYQWGGDKGQRIGFAEKNDLVVCGRQPLGVFINDLVEVQRIASDEQLVRPLRLAMASLGPMSPLIDLVAQRNYLPYSSDGWTIPPTSRVFPYPHVITVNASLPSTWSDFLEPEAEPYRAEDRQAIGLMHCFASAVAHAQARGLADGPSGGLDRPICLQAVCSDGVHFDFITFQLNSLSLSDRISDARLEPPNLVWIDGNNRLFDKVIPKRSMLRNTKYQDLDLSVLLRLASFYLWGCLPVDRSSTASSNEQITEREGLTAGSPCQ